MAVTVAVTVAGTVAVTVAVTAGFTLFESVYCSKSRKISPPDSHTGMLGK